MFEQGFRLRHCDECSTSTRFEALGVYPDGSQRMICAVCQVNGGVLHRCQPANPFSHPDWLPLLLVGIEIVCPKCKAAYDLGIKIEPTSPGLGAAFQAAGLVVGCFVVAGVIVEIAQSLKRAMNS